MWDVLGVGWFLTFLGAGRSGSGGFGTFWGSGRWREFETFGVGRVWGVRGALGEADWVWRAPQLAYTEASCCEAKCFVRARAKGSDKTFCLAAYRFAAGCCMV